MDDSSVVEYFEKFSQHAFGDTSSVQTTCVLLTPQKRPVPCAFCFTIKRDVFDIPMMIVGNVIYPVLTVVPTDLIVPTSLRMNAGMREYCSYPNKVYIYVAAGLYVCLGTQR